MARAFIHLRQIYRKLLWEFLKESGINGLKIFLSTPAIPYAKHIWFIILTGIIIITHVVIINLIMEYLDQPTEIRLSTQLKQSYKSPFPAVAVCSANKISRRKLIQYAEKVYQAQEALQSGLLAKNATEMADQLLLLTGFFLYPFDTYSDVDPRISKLHNILTSMYNGSEYPTREILYQLSPDCEDVIIRGMVFGEEIDVTRYFQKRSTSAGACCLFNYHRETYTTNITRATWMYSHKLENVTFRSNTVLNSAQFVLQSDPSDFTHTEFASYAFRLHLFPQKEYPIIMTNTLGELLVNHQQITEIPVQPALYDATHSIRSFSPEVRKCYFVDEGQRFFNRSYYSLDECLLMCRMLNMQQYCGCVNPLLAPTLINASPCSLMQLPCLTQWMRLFNRWSYFNYIELVHGFLDTCNRCLPTCNGVNYKYFNNDSPLREATVAQPYTNGLLKGLTSVKPLALIKLYFNQKYVESTVKDITSDWVVLLSRFGGILSLFFGFSLISYIEILYFFSGKWFVLLIKAWNLTNKGKQQRSTTRTIEKKFVRALARRPTYSLYWNELQPKFSKLKKYPKNIAR